FVADHRLRRPRLRLRAVEVSDLPAGAWRDPRTNRRRSLHEHDDQLLERLDRIFHAADLRDDRGFDRDCAVAPLCTAPDAGAFGEDLKVAESAGIDPVRG